MKQKRNLALITTISRRNAGSVRTIRRTTVLRRSIGNEEATTNIEWRSLQEEGPPHVSINIGVSAFRRFGI